MTRILLRSSEKRLPDEYLTFNNNQPPPSFEDSLREVNALHQEGYFKRFGISNYMSWDLVKIYDIRDKYGWIRPTVYKGIYSALQRTTEAELFPAFGIMRNTEDFEPGSRFDLKKWQVELHLGRYGSETCFDAMDVKEATAQWHGLTVAEVALRWENNHSRSKSELNDAITVGASSVKHLEGNLMDLVEALEMTWMKVKGAAPRYWR